MKISQQCLTLCDPMDYTVHGILQARLLQYPSKWFPCLFSYLVQTSLKLVIRVTLLKHKSVFVHFPLTILQCVPAMVLKGKI